MSSCTHGYSGIPNLEMQLASPAVVPDTNPVQCTHLLLQLLGADLDRLLKYEKYPLLKYWRNYNRADFDLEVGCDIK